VAGVLEVRTVPPREVPFHHPERIHNDSFVHELKEKVDVLVSCYPSFEPHFCVGLQKSA
jgi:hypothetical protein